MKQVRARDGQVRLWFEDGEIDTIVERELNLSGLMPTRLNPVVDIERFVEQHLGVAMDQYAELDAEVLGVTSFVGGRRPSIDINKDLTGAAIDREDPFLGVLGRWRATIAHEAGHVLLHTVLFAQSSANLDLFAARDLETSGTQRCLKRDLGSSGSADWREFQANQAMASLLMPRSLFAEVVRSLLDEAFPGHRGPASEEMLTTLSLTAAQTFKVSRQAARIRIIGLKLVSVSGQQSL